MQVLAGREDLDHLADRLHRMRGPSKMRERERPGLRERGERGTFELPQTKHSAPMGRSYTAIVHLLIFRWRRHFLHPPPSKPGSPLPIEFRLGDLTLALTAMH